MTLRTFLAVFIGSVMLAVLGAGCSSVSNNHLRPEDFSEYLMRSGMKVDSSRKMTYKEVEAFRATSGSWVTVDGVELMVFKFDRSSKLTEKALEQIAAANRMYFIGVPLPVEVRGSFVFTGMEKSKRKHEIIKVIDQFY